MSLQNTTTPTKKASKKEQEGNAKIIGTKMNQKGARFNGCYKRVQHARQSGWSDEQILENAHQLYKSENSNSNFLLVDCWRLLKDEPKWNTMYQPKGGKRKKVSESGAFTSSSNADISDDEVREVRPTGQKAAKSKGKEKKDTHTRFIEIIAWKGQFTRGDHDRPTIMLEVVASQDFWIWHAFFGVPGLNNDFNMLNQSPLFTYILQGQAPQGEKRKLFSRCQEAVRKDVERAFGVLQSRFAIVRGPARFWQKDVLKDIMYACIILHNIIVKDERDAYESLFDFNYDDSPADTLMVEVLHGPISDFSTMLQRNAEIRDRNIHHNLHADLVKYIWSKFGNHFN
ncbi:uncharacterized protein LOC133825380 [Humulus lupulus]|uniref:uncharacterized protein LOC133825380 n=1 Tax=Humulus lupulus TaxID=3486 RepID=UPI002B406438|nr:uncharacterized protein LOC133825380 [Humulus lupulus]